MGQPRAALAQQRRRGAGAAQPDPPLLHGARIRASPGTRSASTASRTSSSATWSAGRIRTPTPSGTFPFLTPVLTGDTTIYAVTPPRMRILMAIDYYRPNVSGLTIYVEHLSEALARRGPHGQRPDATATSPSSPSRATRTASAIVRAPVLARVGKALVAPAILARGSGGASAFRRPPPPLARRQRDPDLASGRLAPRADRDHLPLRPAAPALRRAGASSRCSRAPPRTSRSTAPTA